MNPLQLMNNDMTTFILSCGKIFEQWNDVVAESLKSKNLDNIQRNWNEYQNELNVRMRTYMHAEKEVDAAIDKFESKYR